MNKKDKAFMIMESAATEVNEQIREIYLGGKTPEPELYLAAIQGAQIALRGLRVAMVCMAEMKESEDA